MELSLGRLLVMVVAAVDIARHLYQMGVAHVKEVVVTLIHITIVLNILIYRANLGK